MAVPLRIEAVFFDLDDTLVHTSKNDVSVLESVGQLAEARLPGVDGAGVVARWREAFAATPWDPEGKIDVEIWRAGLWSTSLRGDPAAASAPEAELARTGTECQRAFREGRLEAFRFAPGFSDLLLRLREGGRRTAIITNGHADVQRAKAEACGAEAAVDALLIGGEEERAGGHQKPHPSIFEKALGLTGVSAEAAAMVGDSYSADIRGARAAGLALAVWVHPDGSSAKPPLGPGEPPQHDAVVRDVLELEDVLARFEAGTLSTVDGLRAP